jgi:prepilin-type N-terminal cleavage/methylation domain-containing protein
MESTSRNGARRAGVTLIELLIVIAIIGVVAGIAAISGRAIAQQSSERAALNTVQQAVWQGATLAAARGFRTELCRADEVLTVRRLVAGNACGGEVLRTYEIDPEVTLSLANGSSMVFTPPGTIAAGTLPGEITLTAAGNTYVLEVSLIGEVRVE